MIHSGLGWHQALRDCDRLPLSSLGSFVEVYNSMTGMFAQAQICLIIDEMIPDCTDLLSLARIYASIIPPPPENIMKS